MKRVIRFIKIYGENIAAFQPNARLYLLNVVLSGAASGVFRLLFNFFVLSLGYDKDFLGNMVGVSSLTALIAALPMGYVVDWLGRKRSLLISSLLVSVSTLTMILIPSQGILLGMNILMGLAQSLSGVTFGPFLMENSSDKERTYLFSFSSGISMAAGFVGNWVGGYMPTWMGSWRGYEAISAQAYALALVVVAGVMATAAVPLFFIRKPNLSASQRTSFMPLSYLKNQAGLFSRLILPMLLTSFGAGLIMPFMNVFFRETYRLTDSAVGTMFAWGSLAMGVGLLIAPPLAERMGKIQLVVVTQGMSIPFLFLLGFSPWYGLSAASYYVRLALMNMSGPVYQTFVMEKVEPSARATIASLVSMANSVGWAFSPTISGWIQVKYGFGPAFVGTIILYILSVYFYWRFFWYQSPQEKQEQPRRSI